MITRFRFYFRKKALDTDLNELQASIEGGIDRVPADRGMTGLLASGHTVVAGGAGFTVDVSSGGANPLAGYDALGQRVVLAFEPETLDLTGLFTLPTPGNEKWLTVYLRPIKTGSQTEVEKKPPVFTSVDFRQTEDFQVIVVEGAEAPPTPAKAALTGDLYLADILIANGITDFTGSTFEINRHRVEPVFDAFERGMDGVIQRLVLSAIASGNLRFRDIESSALDLENSILDTSVLRVALANAANPLMTLQDILTRIGTIGSGPAGVTVFFAPGTALGGIQDNLYTIPTDASHVLVVSLMAVGSAFVGVTGHTMAAGIYDVAAATYTGIGCDPVIFSPAITTFSGGPSATVLTHRISTNAGLSHSLLVGIAGAPTFTVRSNRAGLVTTGGIGTLLVALK